MSDYQKITGALDADNVLERAMQRLLFLGTAIQSDGVADAVLGFDAACGLAGMLKELAADIDAVRERCEWGQFFHCCNSWCAIM